MRYIGIICIGLTTIVGIYGFIKIVLDYRRDKKEMDLRFQKEAERINQLERDLIV